MQICKYRKEGAKHLSVKKCLISLKIYDKISRKSNDLKRFFFIKRNINFKIDMKIC